MVEEFAPPSCFLNSAAPCTEEKKWVLKMIWFGCERAAGLVYCTQIVKMR